MRVSQSCLDGFFHITRQELQTQKSQIWIQQAATMEMMAIPWWGRKSETIWRQNREKRVLGNTV